MRIKVCDIQERIDLLKSIFLDLKNKQENSEQQYIIDSSLDQELIKSFKSEVIKQWRLHDGIRKLITEVGCYREQYQLEDKNSSQPLHIFRFLPKAAFIKQTSSDFSIPPDIYSHQITEYEDRFLASLFHVNEHIEVNRENVDDVLMAKYQKMQEKGYTPIIICKNGYPSNVLTKSKNFKPSVSSFNNGFNKVLNFGQYRQTPVYVFNGLTDNSLYLIDLQKFGILTQQVNKSDEMLPLIIQIETISIEKAKEYIDKTTSNELIENSYGNEQAYEANIRQYQTKVIVEIRSNCRFEEIDKGAVQPFIFIDQKIKF